MSGSERVHNHAGSTLLGHLHHPGQAFGGQVPTSNGGRRGYDGGCRTAAIPRQGQPCRQAAHPAAQRVAQHRLLIASLHRFRFRHLV